MDAVAIMKEMNTFLKEKFTTELKDILQGYIKTVEPYQSEQLGKLGESLCLANEEIHLRKTGQQQGYIFTSFDDVMNAIRVPLAKNGLTLMIQMREEEGAHLIYTKLVHTSDQWIESRVRVVPLDQSEDSFRSALNERKKNTVLALLGLSVSGDPSDDNGFRNDEQYIFKKDKDEYFQGQKKPKSHIINSFQYDQIMEELEGQVSLAERIMKQHDITTLKDLRAESFDVVIKQIRLNKKAMNDRD